MTIPIPIRNALRLCGLTAVGATVACGGERSETLAVTNAVIVDGRGNPPLADGVVVIEGERITAVGPATTVPIPAGARVIDADGGTVMPGLADMHVHLVGGWDGESSDMLGYQRYLNALLYAGVTTVLDVGNILPFIQQIRAEVRAGRIVGPRIYMVGPLVDGPNPVWPPLSYVASDAATLRSYVTQLAGAGVDAIKGYAGLSTTLVDSLVRIATAESLGVIVDLGGGGSYPDAVNAGVAALAHAPWGQWDDQTVTAMLQHGTTAITTLAVLESFARRRLEDLAFLDHPLIAATTAPWFLEGLRSSATREMSEQEQQRAAMVTGVLQGTMGNVGRMHEAGIRLVAGTDAPYPGVFQGEGIHRELELLVEAGLSPVDAIAAATGNAAAFMGADDEWGVVAPGRIADLIVVRGSPAERIQDTRTITTVIQHGRILDREALTFAALDDPGFRTVGTVAGN